jgi:methylated-DNA-[protein]-cysteine S-methyltransferase
MSHFYKTVQTPVGALKLVASDKGLAAVLWENDDPKRVRLGELIEGAGHPVLARAESQLKEYFAGTRTEFDVPLDPAGTEFQKSVWDALGTIPFGETRSYAQIASAVGKPAAVRAVGAANGRNPISIITPCHRVIGADGSLTGFAGGLEAKRFLLDHEGPRQAA